MIAYSNETPEMIIQRAGGYQFRYNITEEIVTDEVTNTQRTQFKFEYVEVNKIEREMLIDAIITDKYPYAAQIGKVALPPCNERDEYVAFVNSVKELVDSILL